MSTQEEPEHTAPEAPKPEEEEKVGGTTVILMKVVAKIIDDLYVVTRHTQNHCGEIRQLQERVQALERELAETKKSAAILEKVTKVSQTSFPNRQIKVGFLDLDNGRITF